MLQYDCTELGYRMQIFDDCYLLGKKDYFLPENSQRKRTFALGERKKIMHILYVFF